LVPFIIIIMSIKKKKTKKKINLKIKEKKKTYNKEKEKRENMYNSDLIIVREFLTEEVLPKYDNDLERIFGIEIKILREIKEEINNTPKEIKEKILKEINEFGEKITKRKLLKLIDVKDNYYEELNLLWLFDKFKNIEDPFEIGELTTKREEILESLSTKYEVDRFFLETLEKNEVLEVILEQKNKRKEKIKSKQKKNVQVKSQLEIYLKSNQIPREVAKGILDIYKVEQIEKFLEGKGGIDVISGFVTEEQKRRRTKEVMTLNEIDLYKESVESIIELITEAKKNTNKIYNIAIRNDFDSDGAYCTVAWKYFEEAIEVLNIKNIKIEQKTVKNEQVRGATEEDFDLDKEYDLILFNDLNYVPLDTTKKPKSKKVITFDHHHDERQMKNENPGLQTDNYIAVNPLNSNNPNQIQFSAAGLTSNIIESVIKRIVTKEDLFDEIAIDTENRNQINKILKSIEKTGRSGNTSDVTIKDHSIIGLTFKEQEKLNKVFNKFNKLNYYKRDQVFTKESFYRHLNANINQPNEEVNELWDELNNIYREIIIMSENNNVSKGELYNKVLNKEINQITFEQIDNLLINYLKDNNENKVTEKQQRIESLLNRFGNTHKKIIKYVKNNDSINRKKYGSTLTTGILKSNDSYRFSGLANPSTTETQMLFKEKIENGKIKGYQIVNGRSDLEMNGEEGWELYEEELNKEINLIIANKLIEKNKQGKLSKSELKILNKNKQIVNFQGHGAAHGGTIYIPKELGLEQEEMENIYKQIIEGEGSLIHKHIKEVQNKIENTKVDNMKELIITEEQMILLPEILKSINLLTDGNAIIKKVIIKMPEKTLEDKKEDTYGSEATFTDLSIIIPSELEKEVLGGKFVEASIMGSSFMVKKVISKEDVEAKKRRGVKVFNNGNPLVVLHSEMLETEVKVGKEFENKSKEQKIEALDGFEKNQIDKLLELGDLSSQGIYISTEEYDTSTETKPKIDFDIEAMGSTKSEKIFNLGFIIDNGQGKKISISIFLNVETSLASEVLTKIQKGFLTENGLDYSKLGELDIKIKELLKTFNEYIMVAHNGISYDWRMLEDQFKETSEIMLKELPLLDTVKSAREAMEHYGLELGDYKDVTTFQDFDYIKEQSLESFISFDKNWSKNKKLYNLYEPNEYFYFEESMDTTSENEEIYLKYRKKDGTNIAILKKEINKEGETKVKDVNTKQEITEEEFKKQIKPKKLSTKYSVDLINKLKEVHNIHYEKNKGILDTKHNVESLTENGSLGDYLKEDLYENYYFTLNKDNNHRKFLSNYDKEKYKPEINKVLSKIKIKIENGILVNVAESSKISNRLITYLNKHITKEGLMKIPFIGENINLLNIINSIEKGSTKITSTYSTETFYEETIEEIIRETTKKFLNENNEKAKISEEITLNLFLIRQGYISNISFVSMSKEEIEYYIKNIESRTNIDRKYIRELVIDVREEQTKGYKDYLETLEEMGIYNVNTIEEISGLISKVLDQKVTKLERKEYKEKIKEIIGQENTEVEEKEVDNLITLVQRNFLISEPHSANGDARIQGELMDFLTLLLGKDVLGEEYITATKDSIINLRLGQQKMRELLEKENKRITFNQTDVWVRNKQEENKTNIDKKEIKEYIGLKKITNKIEKEKKTNLNEQITKKITSKNWEEEIYFKNNLMNQTIISRYDDEELIILKKYYGKRFQKVVEEQITIKSFINQYEENDFPKNRNKYKKFIEVETEKLLRDDLTVDEIMLRLNNNFNLEENEIYSIKEYIINKRNLKQVEEIEKENKVITNRINDLEGKYDIFISETGKNLVGKLRGLMDKDKDKKLATYTKMKKSEKVLSVEEQKSLVEGLVDEIVLEITKTKEELIDCKKENIEETIRIVLDEIIKYMIKTNKVTRDNVELLKEDVMEIIGKIKVEKYKAAPQTMDGFYELLNEYPYIQNQNQMINKENKKETGREPR